MPKVFRIASYLLVSAFAIYHLYYFVLPGVTVINRSGDVIELAHVSLPSSGLDFGRLDPASENTIYYALEQSDGVYQIRIVFAGGAVINGACGAVASNEIHKHARVFGRFPSVYLCEERDNGNGPCMIQS